MNNGSAVKRTGQLSLRDHLGRSRIENQVGKAAFPRRKRGGTIRGFLILDIGMNLGATLFPGIMVESHDRVRYLSD
jgi:hypothetical protein